MFSIWNVRKYLDDNSERFPDKEEIFAKAKEFLSEGSDHLNGCVAQKIFGPEEGRFFLSTITRDPKHLNIFFGGCPDPPTEKSNVLSSVLKTLQKLSDEEKITIVTIQ